MDMRRIVFVVSALLVSVSIAAATPPCTGPMAKSCIKKLFRCFKPKGACVGELVISATAVQTRQCWDNGARILIDADAGGGTVQYRGARGRRCLLGALVVANGDGGAFVFKRKRKTWTVRSGDPDGLVVTCPDGKAETYTEDEVNAEPASCGGFSAGTVCTMGACP